MAFIANPLSPGNQNEGTEERATVGVSPQAPGYPGPGVSGRLFSPHQQASCPTDSRRLNPLRERRHSPFYNGDSIINAPINFTIK